MEQSDHFLNTTELRDSPLFCQRTMICSVPTSQLDICHFAAFLGRTMPAASEHFPSPTPRTCLLNPLEDNVHMQKLITGIQCTLGKTTFQWSRTQAHLLTIHDCLHFSQMQDACYFAFLTMCFLGILGITFNLPKRIVFNQHRKNQYTRPTMYTVYWSRQQHL